MSETKPVEAKVGETGDDDRMMKDVVAPPRHPLSRDRIFPNGAKTPNIKEVKEHLLKEGRIDEEVFMEIVESAGKILKQEPNVLNLKYPITVCGDVHGQFFDLARLFNVGGDPEKTQYLFLGDYVDRGCFSTECVMLLFCMKMNYPKSFFMLRGNHECRQLTAFFNFKDECLYKYSEKLYDAIMETFDKLPLAAIVNDSFFCVHGGLSPDITTIEEIADMHRFREVPRDGPMCDLLWSDPFEDDKTSKPAEEDSDSDEEAAETTWFGYNKTRQCSYVYGVEAVKHFLEENKMTSIIRAHEAQVDGYKMQMVNPQSKIPRVITIFSAPNYCDVYKNKAACLKFDNNVLNIKQFIETPHPYYLPNFMDVFQWSLPFVAEKVTDMLANILDYPEEDTTEAPESALQQRGGMLKKKVMAVSRILRFYKILRQNNESILSLKQLTPNHRVPLGLLSKGPEAIKKAIAGFESAKAADAVNEKHPESKKLSKKEKRGSRRFSKPGLMTNSSQTFKPMSVDIVIEEDDSKSSS
mmetsp:Transcript_11710/g.28849  ORF Transcript_11710/g.28849 Transcript_11710/m.28849 type:complete len:525 (-) Transcript_11710:339-1913(-)|eukprot:CAMPEP_0114516188 /NCGR_PEP_ID=MMETSP0109-20121206/17194_1 /TAXON_ID=29199 /ORGANISM="Chlorarachnion reptans, Strain CCCM449" /LENGTH=524 /DNA_ID=CAMNT_0001696559 /DNA_START=22 /DNA_END=1596 /DNA_ORIENTATION=+